MQSMGRRALAKIDTHSICTMYIIKLCLPDLDMISYMIACGYLLSEC